MMTNLFRSFGMLAISLVALSGCSTFKHRVGDSSLDYTKTTKLDPIVLPANAQTLPFTPLYQVPISGENTLKIKNDSGKRYDLPKPINTIK